jgi:hypothetical protein
VTLPGPAKGPRALKSRDASAGRDGAITTQHRTVAFATHAELPDGSPDDLPAIPELRALGIEASPVVWDDPAVDWSRFDAVILRSTWGYDRRAEEFLAWVDRVARTTTLWNPASIVRWNAHKGYLVELARSGAAIVPTELLPRGSSRTLDSVLADRGWGDVVLKPAVGANAAMLRVVRRDERAAGASHLRDLLASGDALVQPLLHRVETVGERSLVFLDGAFSHAAEYPHVLAGGSREGVPVEVDVATRKAAERIVATLPLRPLYARVDFLPAETAGWCLSELELIEPYLFLRTDAEAPRRFARAIRDRLDRAD